MATIIFHFNGNKISIQCQIEDSFDKISQQLANKINKNAENLLFIYNGSYIKKEQTFEQIVNYIDKNGKTMDV